MENLTALFAFLKSARRNGTTRLLQQINKYQNCLVLVRTDKEKKKFTNAVSIKEINDFYGVAGPKDKPLPLIIEKDLFHELLSELTEALKDKDDLLNKWIKEADLRSKEGKQDHVRLQEGRHYLMGVNPKDLTVEDCLEAFGWTRDGLNTL